MSYKFFILFGIIFLSALSVNSSVMVPSNHTVVNRATPQTLHTEQSAIAEPKVFNLTHNAVWEFDSPYKGMMRVTNFCWVIINMILSEPLEAVISMEMVSMRL